LGFVTGSIRDDSNRNTTGRNLISIFVPTTPNPTTGFYIMMPEEEVKEIQISIEDAFKIIISGGLADNQIQHVNSGKEYD